MSYNVVTTEGIRTFENIDDAGDYAQEEEGEVLYCGNCSKWYVSWFPLTEVKTIWGRRPEWWIRIFHRKPYETIIQQIRRETK